LRLYRLEHRLKRTARLIAREGQSQHYPYSRHLWRLWRAAWRIAIPFMAAHDVISEVFADLT